MVLTLWVVAVVVVGVGEIDLGADHVDLGLGVEPGLADAGIDQWGLVAGVAADNDDAVGLLNADNGRVHRVV